MNEQINKKIAVIYCRVSTKEQVEEGNSLTTQEKACRDYAQKHEYNVSRVFVEQGESAKTADRTELKQLLTYCSVKKNGISAIIAYKLDRISRNIDDYSQIRILLKRYGVEIKSTTEHFENNPAGRFMENIIANVAQFDNDVRTERCIGGMREAAREGRYVWIAPTGYDNAKVTEKSTIVQNDMAAFVYKTFKMIATNSCPVEEVRRQMSKEGLSTKKGKPLSKSHFYRLLNNEAYAGWICKFGERHKGLYEPVISDELFEQVQRVLKHRSHRSFAYQLENPDFPLRRFVFHPDGTKLTGSWSQGRSKKYAYYRFKNPGLEFKKQYLDEQFKEFLDLYQFNRNNYQKFVKLAKENLIDANKGDREKSEETRKHVTEIQEKQDALIDKNHRGVISDAILQKQLNRLEQELLSAHALLEGLPEENVDVPKLIETVNEFLEKPGEIWENAPFDCKLELQWFKFPQGVTFDGKEFRTAQISTLFKVKESFSDPLYPNVHFKDLKTNNPDVPTIPKNAEPAKRFWKSVENEMVKLAGIINKIKEHPT
jgi:site-specific DNA recombinase